MKKTLLCLIVGIAAFLIGTSIFNWLSFSTERPPAAYELQILFGANDDQKVWCMGSNQDSSAQTAKEDQPDETEYSPSPDGAYFPDDEIENDTALILGIFDESRRADVKIGNKIYRSESPLINEREVVFKTIKTHEIEYSFRGVFLRNPFKIWIEDGDTNLKGLLIKKRNGKTIYKIQTQFSVDSEVCAWRDIDFKYQN